MEGLMIAPLLDRAPAASRRRGAGVADGHRLLRRGGHVLPLSLEACGKRPRRFVGRSIHNKASVGITDIQWSGVTFSYR